MSTLPPRPAHALRCMTRIKLVNAAAMTRAEYAEYMGMAPAPGDADNPGFLVEAFDPPYPANDTRHRNAIQWVPAAVFTEAFSNENGLSFGQALEALRRDWTVARPEWNKERFIRLHASSKAPYLACTWASKREVAYWQPTQADMMATDWEIVGDDAPPPAPAP